MNSLQKKSTIFLFLQKISSKIRPLSKLSEGRGFEGDMEPRPAAHFLVREDSSTGSTYKSSTECRVSKEVY
nr:palindromic element RPE1 domain-containing protein [Candidatus Trichorickettsia mobilis]